MPNLCPINVTPALCSAGTCDACQQNLRERADRAEYLENVIKGCADLFDTRAENAELDAKTHRTPEERAFWSGRGQVYRITAFTLRSHLRT